MTKYLLDPEEQREAETVEAIRGRCRLCMLPCESAVCWSCQRGITTKVISHAQDSPALPCAVCGKPTGLITQGSLCRACWTPRGGLT